MNLCKVATTVRQNFCNWQISQMASKKGGRNIRNKNICEGSSDTLRNYCNMASVFVLLV